MQNKEQIIEEFNEDCKKNYRGLCLECCDYEKMIEDITNFWLSKLTQAYNEGARDMVERITRDILDYNLAGALPRSQEGLEILLENLKKEYEL